MSALKQRDRDALDFIRAEMETKGIPPSFDEIAGFIGSKSRGAVRRRINRLVAAGLLRKLPYHARALELIEAKDYHRPDCDCDGCAATRYLEQLKLVKALQVSPEKSLIPKLRGLKPLSTYTKAYWLLGFPARPERSARQ